jgi:hypothetical protein
MYKMHVWEEAEHTLFWVVLVSPFDAMVFLQRPFEYKEKADLSG